MDPKNPRYSTSEALLQAADQLGSADWVMGDYSLSLLAFASSLRARWPVARVRARGGDVRPPQARPSPRGKYCLQLQSDRSTEVAFQPCGQQCSPNLGRSMTFT
jgi:hypothetical protein